MFEYYLRLTFGFKWLNLGNVFINSPKQKSCQEFRSRICAALVRSAIYGRQGCSNA
jgi:hypothetical protein